MRTDRLRQQATISGEQARRAGWDFSISWADPVWTRHGRSGDSTVNMQASGWPALHTGNALGPQLEFCHRVGRRRCVTLGSEMGADEP